MISCTETILSYNELFSFLHEKYGEQAVLRFWEAVSDRFLRNLRELVREKGVQGMLEYWGRTLPEEGAAHEITVKDDDFFRIEIFKCPSVGVVRRNRHIKKYPDYCRHCDALYRRIIEDYGFSYKIEYLDEEKGVCRITVRKKRGIPRKKRSAAKGRRDV